MRTSVCVRTVQWDHVQCCFPDGFTTGGRLRFITWLWDANDEHKYILHSHCTYTYSHFDYRVLLSKTPPPFHMNLQRSQALQFPQVSIWSHCLCFYPPLLLCIKNLFQSSAIPPSSLQSVFFSFSLAPASQHRRCPSFLRVGLSSWMKQGGGVDLSWANLNWTAVHSDIFFFLMGACMCVCVCVCVCVHVCLCVCVCVCVWVWVWASLCRNSWPQKPRVVAAHNYVLLQGIWIAELELAFTTVSHTWGWQLLSNLVKENMMPWWKRICCYWTRLT